MGKLIVLNVLLVVLAVYVSAKYSYQNDDPEIDDEIEAIARRLEERENDGGKIDERYAEVIAKALKLADAGKRQDGGDGDDDGNGGNGGNGGGNGDDGGDGGNGNGNGNGGGNGSNGGGGNDDGQGDDDDDEDFLFECLLVDCPNCECEVENPCFEALECDDAAKRLIGKTEDDDDADQAKDERGLQKKGFFRRVWRGIRRGIRRIRVRRIIRRLRYRFGK